MLYNDYLNKSIYLFYRNGVTKFMNLDITVIFDMDGILLDTEMIYMKAWEERAITTGLDVDDIKDMVLACTGTTSDMTRKIMIERLGSPEAYEEGLEFTREYFHKYINDNGIPVKKYARDILKYLHSNNIATGLASSTREAVVRQQMKDTGLYEYFSVILGGDNVVNGKPAPDIFLDCAKKLKAEPSNCYVIEDSFNGIKAAHAAGMHPVMVPDLRQPDDEIKGLAEVVLQDLNDVIKYFDKM